MNAPKIVFTAKDVAAVVNIAVGQLKRRGVNIAMIRDVLLYAGADIALSQNWTPEVLSRHITEYCKSERKG